MATFHPKALTYSPADVIEAFPIKRDTRVMLDIGPQFADRIGDGAKHDWLAIAPDGTMRIISSRELDEYRHVERPPAAPAQDEHVDNIVRAALERLGDAHDRTLDDVVAGSVARTMRLGTHLG